MEQSVCIRLLIFTLSWSFGLYLYLNWKDIIFGIFAKRTLSVTICKKVVPQLKWIRKMRSSKKISWKLSSLPEMKGCCTPDENKLVLWPACGIPQFMRPVIVKLVPHPWYIKYMLLITFPAIQTTCTLPKSFCKKHSMSIAMNFVKL